MISQAKSLFRQAGLFPVARNLYRNLSPSHRKERLFNKRFYNEMINPGDLCFDIGANLGQTIEALLENNAVVVAVEPNPNCLPVLNYQFPDNPNLTIVNKGIGSTPGSAQLHFKGTDSTASMRDDWPFATDQTLEVEIITLDDMIAQFGLPKFLKVDVEGFELEVFKGLSQPISLIYFEMHGDEMDLVFQIFERLSTIGEIAGINVVSGDNSSWLIDGWVKPNELLAKLGEPVPRRANIVVKMNT
ncbi:MAG: FkbM family methyltransferase [Cyanobacteria bacterium J06633_8]